MGLKKMLTFFKKKDILQRAADAWQNNETKLAFELYQDVLKIDNDNFQALFWGAVLFDQQKNYQKALEYFERAKNVNQEDYRVFYSLGFVYLKMHQNNNALLNFNIALQKLKPNKVSVTNDYLNTKFDLFYHMAVIHLRLSDYEKTIELANNALSIYPDNVETEKLKMAAYQSMTA